jgi:DNA-binding transcriptional ArsR family regulator
MQAVAPEQETLELADPRAMRALAHPARLAILELLHAEGTVTATACAQELGGSPQAASYHLRALGRWGFTRRVESPDGRESRWELAARTVTFTSEESPRETRSAARALARRVLERDEKITLDYLEAEADEPEEWRDVAALFSGNVYATTAELDEIAAQFHRVVQQYGRHDEADRPEGARQVHIVFRALPRVKPTRKRRT